MSIALMYHALFTDDADLQHITPEDRPYALSLTDFEAQMAMLAAEPGLTTGLPGEAGHAMPDVILTFDDGHISNRDLALPVLQQHGLRACFFVTTGYIGQRPGFCHWEDLQVLSSAGMLIGTHGSSHEFFDDMSATQAYDELSRSRNQVSDTLGVSVNSMSFPGGRYNQAVLRTARDLGYSHIFGSEFGLIKSHTEGQTGKPMRRLPIRQRTPMARFRQLIRADRRLFLTESAKTQGKQILKKTLGNQIYHGLYTTLAKRH